MTKNKFLAEQESYATDIYYNNKEFTPQEITDWFTQTKKQNFAKSSKIEKIVKESNKIFNGVVKNYKLKMDENLTAKYSEGAKALAHLILLHSDICYSLNYNSKNFVNQYVFPFEY